MLSRLLLLLLLLIPSQVLAFQIHLKDGRVIDTPSYEKKGDTIVYQKYGGDISVPMAMVDRIVVQKSMGADQAASSLPSARPARRRPAPAPPGGTRDGQAVEDGPMITVQLKPQLIEALNPTRPLELASLAVVYVQAIGGTLSGFFVSRDGLLLTSRHGVQGRVGPSIDQQRLKAEEEKLKSLREYEQQLAEQGKELEDYARNLEKNRKEIARFAKQATTAEQRKQLAQARSRLKKNEKTLKSRQEQYKTQQKKTQDLIAQCEAEIARIKGQEERLRTQEDFTLEFADGTTGRARLVSVSPTLDLALLRAQGVENAPVIEPATTQVNPGDTLYAIAASRGLKVAGDSGPVTGFDADYIDFQAQIYPAASGGPVVTEEGKVVGVAVADPARADGSPGRAIRFDRASREFGGF